METLATVFVKWKPFPYDEIVNRKEAELRRKINAGQKLSREEKNYITRGVNNNSYFKRSIPVGGWRFNFEDVLHRYLVNLCGYWCEIYACDKTALRCYLGTPADEIIATD